MTHHLNTGSCQKCVEIFDRFPGFHLELRAWFIALQAVNKDAHISCAGRGRAEQEDCFTRGASKAHYGQSSHNYNAAIDIFRLTQAGGASWDKPWFEVVIGPAVHAATIQLKWYGEPGATFYELPHVEIAAWRSLGLVLVE